MTTPVTHATHVATKLKCPFANCKGDMTPLSGKDAARKLLDVLVSPKSTMATMARASAADVKKGALRECSECGYLAVFAK